MKTYAYNKAYPEMDMFMAAIASFSTANDEPQPFKFIYGDNKNNVLIGNDTNYNGYDAIYGGGGDDRLFGLGGSDTLRGESGNDYLDGGADDDILYGGTGHNTFVLNGGHDIAFMDENFKSYDTIVVNGNGAVVNINQNMIIKSGDMTYDYGDFYQLVVGRNGDGLVLGFDETGTHYEVTLAGVFELPTDWEPPVVDPEYNVKNGTSRKETLRGTADNDELHGRNGNDKILGNDADDFLFGDKGNDILDGGDGDDYLFGGSGNDTMYLRGGFDTANGGAGRDRIIIEGDGAVEGFNQKHDVLEVNGKVIHSGRMASYAAGENENGIVLEFTVKGEEYHVTLVDVFDF